VPPNKELVIETVSAEEDVPSGQGVVLLFDTQVNGNHALNRVALTPSGTFLGTQAVFVATHAVRLYADPGSTVVFTLQRSDITGQGSFGGVLTGYLVDCEAGTNCTLH
jgi:hypothetical protein